MLKSRKTFPCSAAVIALAMPHVATADTAPGARAAATVQQMTADEKVVLTHGIMPLPFIPGTVVPADAIPGAGYVAGVARLGVPALRETDASLGVAWVGGLRHDGATAMP